MRDPWIKKLYCLLWCRIIHETIRPKLNYATIFMINAIVHIHMFVNFITLDFSSIFPNPEFWDSFSLISICPQITNFLNQFFFRLQKTSSKGGLYTYFFYFRIDFFSGTYLQIAKKSSLYLKGEVLPVWVARFKKDVISVINLFLFFSF